MDNFELVKKRLIELKDDYTSRIAAIEVDTNHKNEPVEKDFAEQATQSENDDVLVALKDEAHQMIMQVDAALNAIDDGRYGVCTECGESIPPARLEAAPFARLCIECAKESAH